MATSTLRDIRCQRPIPSAAATAEMMFSTYNSAMTDSFPGAAKYVTVKADSGLTYAHLPVVSRKRSREDSNNSINMNQFIPFAENFNNYTNNNNVSSAAGSFTFLGEDFSSQIRQDQLEVDRLIDHHMEKVRVEMEERRRKCSRTIMAAVEESIVKKLKAKEEEIEKIGKLNSVLVDRVKSLYVENQIWRDLAQTNEATATALRSNLEQVLAQVQDDHHHHDRHEVHAGATAAELVDDAQSCCGSNYNEDMILRTQSHIEKCVAESSHRGDSKLCKSCGKEEACVLLLPCRHLCLCSGCGSYLHICPVCNCNKSCSLHVNLST